MLFLLRLVLGNLLVRRARTGLTLAAVALAVSLVVAVTSGYNSVESAARGYVNQHYGSTDATVSRPDDPHAGIDPSVVTQLRADKDVRSAVVRLETSVPLPIRKGQAPNAMIRTLKLTGVQADDPAVARMRFIKGTPPGPDWNGAILDPASSERMELDIDGRVQLKGPHGALDLPVTGKIHKPALAGMFGGATIYVPLKALQAFAYPAGKPRVSEITLEFQPGIDPDAFLKRWRDRFAAGDDKLLKMTLVRDSRAELDNKLLGMRLLSTLGGAVSMVAATFIIFSTLAMGVAERQRILAMMRAVGAVKWQIGALVLIEGLLLAGAGAALGVPLGWVWVKCLSLMYPFLFAAGVVLDGTGILLATAGSLVAAIAASLLPAWQAMRVSPLEAMSPQAGPERTGLPWRSMLAGLVLIALDPVLLFGFHSRETRFFGHFVVGLPALMLGFFLLAPTFVWGIEKALGPVVAWGLRVRFALLRQQLSAGIWRAAGTCASLMVGLSVLVVMQTQGNSALSSWKIPDHFPDVFISAGGLGFFGPEDQAKLKAFDKFKAGDVMPMGIFSPEVGEGIMGLVGTQFPNNTTFVAIDPDQAFRMMELDFREGTPESAAALLKKGHHLVITEEFRKLKGFKVGDTFKIKSALKGELDYTVAGVVWSPGIDVMVNTFDLGKQFSQQSAACVFGTLDDAREDFGVQSVFIMGANLKVPIERDALATELRGVLGSDAVTVADVRLLKYEIQNGFRKLLMVASTVAWAAMAVASLGVTNTIIASVRSRRWQFGVLRAVGVDRSTLLRLVLAEGLLLGLVGCALGLCAGLLMAVDAMQLSNVVLGFSAPILVPWGIVSLGVAIIVAVSVGASLIPAWQTARTSPLELLQAGRAAA